MLTLFKPWRTGTTLKTKGASWDEAFTAHVFTSRQEQIMKNFNIRYECLDQRDDFLSELKKGATALNDDLDADEMEQTAVLDDVLVDDMGPNDIDIDDQQSQRYKQLLKNMSITKHIMTRLGWTACEPNTSALASHESVSGIRIGCELKKWLHQRDEIFLRAGCKVSDLKLVNLVLFHWAVNCHFKVSKLSTQITWKKNVSARIGKVK